MGQPRQTTEEVHENLCELLDWQFAERHDQAHRPCLAPRGRRRRSTGWLKPACWMASAPFWRQAASRRAGRLWCVHGRDHTCDCVGRTDSGAVASAGVVTVDETRVVTAPTFQGCGKLRVTERQRNRQGVQVASVKFLFGWRLIALLDLRTLIPLALKQVLVLRSGLSGESLRTATAPDRPHSRRLLDRG